MNIERIAKLSKYNSKKVKVDGIEFDSKQESRFYLYLKEKLDRKEIKSFELQPSYELTPKFIKCGKTIRAITYAPDFKVIYNDDTIELYDVKGFSTQASEIRKKLFDYRYPDIKLTWITYVKKYGGWIETDKLKKIRKENKK